MGLEDMDRMFCPHCNTTTECKHQGRSKFNYNYDRPDLPEEWVDAIQYRCIQCRSMICAGQGKYHVSTPY